MSQALLAAEQLTVGIGMGASQKIFCRTLSLQLHAGECLAILGRNGAGKSTLLSALAGLRAPFSGAVLLKGQTYAALGAKRSARIRGWLPQTRGDAFSSTVLETALVGRHPHLDRWGWESEKDARIVRRALSAVDLTGFEQRDIQTLSGGERQRLAIATLLAQEPQLYLLDEPIAHLDLKHQMAVLKCFSVAASQQNAAVVMVLHEPALAWRFCNRILLLHGDGQSEIGSRQEMLTVEKLSQLYQYPLRMTCDADQRSFFPA